MTVSTGHASPPQDAGLEARLNKRIAAYSVSEAGYPEALLRAAQDFEIPLGLEWLELPTDPQPISLSFKDANVQQIMKRIADSRAGYKAEVRDGVLHVFYAGAATDKTNFLNIKILKFSAHDEYIARVRQRLQNFLHGTFVQGTQPAPGTAKSEVREIVVSGGDHKATFEVQEGTVRDVLDRMALATDAKAWVVTFDADAATTQNGFKRARSIWGHDKNPLPDRYQPWWDMAFARGTAISSKSSTMH